MVGRYPGYDVMQQAHTWDRVTREIVEKRLLPQPKRRFFSDADAAVAAAFCDTVTAQHAEPRIPVLSMVDTKLAAGRLDGYRYADMPDDGDTWRRALRGLDEVAHERYGSGFAENADEVREAIVAQFAAGTLQGGVWGELNCKRAFSVMLRSVVSEFYSHPWAWNEIGFGGPAYPRGYMRLGEGMREPYEKPEALHTDPVRALDQPDT